jgi:hypothetical protein
MKTRTLGMMLAVIAILPITFCSCHDEFLDVLRGHGEIVEQTVNLDDFDGFVSSIYADIHLTQGEKQEVIIQAQQNIIDNIDLTRVENGIWIIHFNQNMVKYSEPVKLFITIPTLTKAGINGYGTITGLTPFINLDQLNLSISGAGSIDLETQSNQMDIIVSGSGDLNMVGNTDQLNMTISGAGDFHGSEFVTRLADLTISGSGTARLAVEEYLRVFVTGSGNVYYTGNPKIDKHILGSGNIYRDH